jgi:hypothetical protein
MSSAREICWHIRLGGTIVARTFKVTVVERDPDAVEAEFLEVDGIVFGEKVFEELEVRRIRICL